jgi:hypothetical protein
MFNLRGLYLDRNNDTRRDFQIALYKFANEEDAIYMIKKKYKGIKK